MPVCMCGHYCLIMCISSIVHLRAVIADELSLLFSTLQQPPAPAVQSVCVSECKLILISINLSQISLS